MSVAHDVDAVAFQADEAVLEAQFGGKSFRVVDFTTRPSTMCLNFSWSSSESMS